MIDQALLYRFFEGETSDEEEVVIKEWLEASDQNRVTFLKERKLFDSIVLLGKPTKKHIPEKKTGQLYHLLREIVKIAAVSAIVLILNHIYHENTKVPVEELYQTISVPAGQRINLLLPDGTDVWLNARTTIRYPFSFNKEKRQVFLDGEAYFDVSEDKQKPFVVHTSKYQLEVLGTTFNVEDYSDNDDFETMLFDGSVNIISKDSGMQSTTLIPTYKASLDSGQLTVTHVDDYSVYRWREGLICFKDESFVDIMKDFEKYYGLTIQIDNDSVRKQRYSGKFRQTDGVEYALRVLQKDIRFTYKRDDDQNIIYIE